MKTVAATVAFASTLSVVLAQSGPIVQTPAAVVQCQPALISFSGGVAPYYISVIPGGQPGATALEQFPNQSGNSYTWTVNIASGTSISLQIRDSTGAVNYSDQVSIQSSSDSSCIGVAASGSGSSTSGTGASSTNASSQAAASSSQAAASSSDSSRSSSIASSSSARSSSTSSRPSSSMVTSTSASGAGASASSATSAAGAAVTSATGAAGAAVSSAASAAAPTGAASSNYGASIAAIAAAAGFVVFAL